VWEGRFHDWALNHTNPWPTLDTYISVTESRMAMKFWHMIDIIFVSLLAEYTFTSHLLIFLSMPWRHDCADRYHTMHVSWVGLCMKQTDSGRQLHIHLVYPDVLSNWSILIWLIESSSSEYRQWATGHGLRFWRPSMTRRRPTVFTGDLWWISIGDVS
jgi:hypothetical protein